MFAKEPLYQQVHTELTKRIVTGEWASGVALPNEYQLSSDLRVSMGTLRKAIDLLVRDNLVDRKQGKGTFVVDRFSPAMRNVYDPIRNADGSPIDWRYGDIQTETSAASELEASILNLKAGEHVTRVRRLRYIGERPVKAELARLPTAIFGDLSGLSPMDTTIVPLVFGHQLRLGDAKERVDVRAASADAAAALNIAPGSMVLRLRRVVVDKTMRPLEWRIAECNLGSEFYSAPVVAARNDAPEEMRELTDII